MTKRMNNLIVYAMRVSISYWTHRILFFIFLHGYRPKNNDSDNKIILIRS